MSGIKATAAVGLSLALGYGGYVAIQSSRQAQELQRTQLALERRQARWSALQQQIEAELLNFNGEVGLVIEDLKTGWRLTHQPERRFPSASLVKVAIMAGYFQAVHDGHLELGTRLRLKAADKVSGSGVLKERPAGSAFTVEELIGLMISESDNTATNLLIDRLGMRYFDRYFQEIGLRQTNLARKMMDVASRAKGVENYTTAAEVALLLERLYRQELVSPGWSRRGLELLKQQKRRDRIPAQLPPETVVAHKTGLERYLCHDAGIVFTDQSDFLIVVLTKSRVSSQTAKTFIATLASRAHQYIVQSR